MIFSPERLHEYRDYLTKVDDELSTLAWLYHMNHGIFMTPGTEEEWTLSIAHSDEDLQRYLDAFEAFATRPHGQLTAQAVSRSRLRSASTGRPRWKPWAMSTPYSRSISVVVVVLDELGDRRLAEAAGDLDDRLDGQLVGVVARHVADEGAVDLDHVEGQSS